MNIEKLRAALAGTLGKTINGFFISEHPGKHFQVFLTFADGTYYEFYGEGHLNGARSLDRGDQVSVRKFLSDIVLEVSANDTQPKSSLVEVLRSPRIRKCFRDVLICTSVMALLGFGYRITHQDAYVGFFFFIAVWASVGATWIAIDEFRYWRRKTNRAGTSAA